MVRPEVALEAVCASGEPTGALVGGVLGRTETGVGGAVDLVSVVIPAYNYGRFVVEAVESALGQTYRPIEVIVVDDGSTDDTPERLQPYLARIRYIRQENKGLSAARNTGIRAARGEWVALLDSDDIWHRQKIEVQMKALWGRGEVGLAGCRSVEEMPAVLDENPPTRLLEVEEFLMTPPIGPSGAIIRRRCFEEVGYFDETLRSVEDRDMWLRLAARFPALHVASPCWWYRTHGAQMSKHADRMVSNYERVLEKFFAEHPQHADLRRAAMASFHVDAGWSYFEEGRRWECLSRLLRSFGCRPFRLGDRQIKHRFPRWKIAIRALVGPPVN